MFALSKVLRRSQRLPLGVCNAVYAKLEVPLERRSTVLEAPTVVFDKSQSFEGFYQFSSDFSTSRRSLSSKADAKGVEEEDLEDGFSELEGAKSAQEASSESDIEDDLVSEELSGDEDDGELDNSDAKSGSRNAMRKRSSELFRAIVSAPGISIDSALDKWLEEGKKINRAEVANAMLNLRRRRMYGRALQMSEWLEAKNQMEFTERDYASRLDLIAKIRGLQKAEAYIEKIPKSFRGEVIYRSLLANCVATSNVKKAEEVFNKMKVLGFPLTSFACDQLLLLYKRVDKKKIADVLLLMEKENIKPSRLTYQTLIDTKGSSNDLTGMEQIVETMKAEGVELDLRTQFILAKHYAAAGLEEKAEKVLKEMEGESLTVNRWACKDLLSVYASLGRVDEVDRIWKICGENPRIDECLAAILAFGKIGKIKEAEEIFEKSLKLSNRVPAKVFSALLRVYVDHKMLSEGKDLVKRMAESNCTIGALTWDALIRLYVDAGEVGKADSLLNKATQQNQMRPLMNSFMYIMEDYAKKGDVHNTEKIFQRMRQAGYVSRFRQFQALLEAYVNAKNPAYGMRDRMKADNIFPNKAMAALLAQTDPFRKTAVSDLLD
ncbi:PREDICTED: pentatricopeptide repeat-containing protein At1g80270, mitochondrial-like [Tarenaya hassleriana]|uniref:pentatricopeptide repeat-containing protein At1g80270, mitochondrial-like n=1 Tax=Tarenaya hassleriana TaxID=28532 RepID=UPI00053C8491|nr:PREDICTED: pentatricopeptide repeat-containing protein At1g80270, mitochondrial-like [Tarenaya hassleriana]XP_010532155.1 PREDICTED: pentatricopeptide repeat-containing protein At1g80270, mitochondrial-like [Tarenaya hassleriana]XP_019057507.1 PREDICTED: pentatricopeptide repeat-containing protein At1g80270, mitochondrial-like [Tarenaya hassleriana]